MSGLPYDHGLHVDGLLVPHFNFDHVRLDGHAEGGDVRAAHPQA
jgi:hypothetical protein